MLGDRIGIFSPLISNGLGDGDLRGVGDVEGLVLGVTGAVATGEGLGDGDIVTAGLGDEGAATRLPPSCRTLEKAKPE